MFARALTVITALLLYGNSFAQGKFEFTWHGDSNYFQASFQVYDYEITTGSNFSSDLFRSSLAITNPLGQTYLGYPGVYAQGGYVPWSVSPNM